MAGPWLAYAYEVGNESSPPCVRLTKPPGVEGGVPIRLLCGLFMSAEDLHKWVSEGSCSHSVRCVGALG